MASKYLDDSGLATFKGKLDDVFDTKLDKILATKTYTNMIGDADVNTQDKNAYYFGSVKPDIYDKTWIARYRVYAYVEDDSNFRALSEVMFIGNQSAVSSYAIFNNIFSTSYRPLYYHNMYRVTSTGFTAGYEHALGFSFTDSNSRGDITKKRTIRVDLLYQLNCTVTLNNTPVLWENWPGGNGTNYGAIATYNFSTNGLQETGDANDNTIAYIIKNYYERPLVGTGKVYPYNLCTYDNDYKLQGFVNSSSTGTGKTKNAATFMIGAPIFYLNSKTEVAAGAYAADNTLLTQNNTVDMRYTLNCGKTLTANKPVYLVGVPSGATFTLANTWYSQALPNSDDGKIYIHLGYAYSTYQIAWQIFHPIYWFKNGALRLYEDSTSYYLPAAGIPKTDLASGVQASLSLADTALQGSAITNMEVTTNKVTSLSSGSTNTQYPSAKLVYDQLALKGTYSKPSGGIPSTDMTSAVQTSLGKADTALQEVPVISIADIQSLFS